MPSTYAVKRLIAADPQTIWNLLTDALNYPTWNPAVLGIEGTIAPGERIKLTSTVHRILDGGSVLGLVGTDNLQVDPGHD